MRYRILTPSRIVEIESASNSVADIAKALRKARIDPRTVQAITPIGIEE